MGAVGPDNPEDMSHREVWGRITASRASPETRQAPVWARGQGRVQVREQQCLFCYVYNVLALSKTRPVFMQAAFISQRGLISSCWQEIPSAPFTLLPYNYLG